MSDYISTAAIYYPNESYLAHHGIKGQKWGVRRYQNEDGSLTPAGVRRYGTVENYRNAQRNAAARKAYNKSFNNAYYRNYQSLSPFKKHRDASTKRWEDAIEKAGEYNAAHKAYRQTKKEYKNSPEGIAARKERNKRLMKVGAAAVGTALVAYGAYKLNQKANQSVSAYHRRKAAEFLEKYNKAMNVDVILQNRHDVIKNDRFLNPNLKQRILDDNRRAINNNAVNLMAFNDAWESHSRKADVGKYTLKEKYKALRGLYN